MKDWDEEGKTKDFTIVKKTFKLNPFGIFNIFKKKGVKKDV